MVIPVCRVLEKHLKLFSTKVKIKQAQLIIYTEVQVCLGGLHTHEEWGYKVWMYNLQAPN